MLIVSLIKITKKIPALACRTVDREKGWSTSFHCGAGTKKQRTKSAGNYVRLRVDLE